MRKAVSACAGTALFIYRPPAHLQSNKAKFVARFADEFQASDSFHTAEVLDRHLTAEDHSLNVFVQVNTSRDPSKYGMEPEKLDALIRKLRPFKNRRVEQVQHAIASGLQFAR
ncbi:MULTISPECIES: hypothetical protein [Serratia]|uniref:Uncharacterized protein n=1 Tax=Serratia marcescens TaxID=615 RepID=A0ABD5BGE0_SERMA|nr:hypothetical protein [Serratia marcescens]MBH2543414.1 hypothetical protein [Serratia marcescens]MBH3210204.1 hypothetical protein [Serratia marcescens]MDQ9378171.1 hypothetical protein [Serratia marcescens]MDQ9404249.1 hypothetical protein [Serratia marcescens]MDQ9426291.1 hypothetical protein [Serratia marcescens]